ncbi:MAG TPA: hypothetical protein VLD19_09665, partial [Chitinophagaceae bacterium]|nr:hypothetical protein [Chitinophagaceae bacterium]
MKYLFPAACLCFITLSARAQDTLELRLGAGYGFSTGLQHLPDEIDYNSSSPKSKPANTSFGRGLYFNADATWWFSSILGFTAGGSYIVTT